MSQTTFSLLSDCIPQDLAKLVIDYKLVNHDRMDNKSLLKDLEKCKFDWALHYTYDNWDEYAKNLVSDFNTLHRFDDKSKGAIGQIPEKYTESILSCVEFRLQRHMATFLTSDSVELDNINIDSVFIGNEQADYYIRNYMYPQVVELYMDIIEQYLGYLYEEEIETDSDEDHEIVTHPQFRDI